MNSATMTLVSPQLLQKIDELRNLPTEQHAQYAHTLISGLKGPGATDALDLVGQILYTDFKAGVIDSDCSTVTEILLHADCSATQQVQWLSSVDIYSAMFVVLQTRHEETLDAAVSIVLPSVHHQRDLIVMALNNPSVSPAQVQYVWDRFYEPAYALAIMQSGRPVVPDLFRSWIGHRDPEIRAAALSHPQLPDYLRVVTTLGRQA